MKENEEMYSSWQANYDTESETIKNDQKIVLMQLNKLSGFKNHPFKVENNTALFELMRSIENDGILDPLLVRPKPDGNGFEIIAGHRRKAACEWVGITEVPVIIRNLDDNQAVIAMRGSELYEKHYDSVAAEVRKRYQEAERKAAPVKKKAPKPKRR